VPLSRFVHVVGELHRDRNEEILHAKTSVPPDRGWVDPAIERRRDWLRHVGARHVVVTDVNDWTFEACQERLRDASRIVYDKEQAYEKMIEATSSEEAPWFVIPADHKWFTRLAVADVIVETLEGLDLHFPEVSEAQRQELQRARALLEGA
jgi:hypothetical protein